jgi:hypothetical protein
VRTKRLTLLLAVLAAVVAVIRARRPEPAPAAPAGSATWPPLDLPTGAEDRSTPADADSSPDADDSDTSTGERTWIDPEPDGSCPLSHPIKLNEPSGIFHVPDGQFYARTKAERCYANAADAEADGFRASRR